VYLNLERYPFLLRGFSRPAKRSEAQVTKPYFTHYRPGRSATEKFMLEDLFSSVLPQFEKCYPSGNLKFNYLGISESLKLRILMEKIIKFLLN